MTLQFYLFSIPFHHMILTNREKLNNSRIFSSTSSAKPFNLPLPMYTQASTERNRNCALHPSARSPSFFDALFLSLTAATGRRGRRDVMRNENARGDKSLGLEGGTCAHRELHDS